MTPLRWALGCAVGFLPVLLSLSARATAPEDDLPPPSPELLAPRPRSAISKSLHPAVPLRDTSGGLVVETGRALSPLQTCGACHDAAWIGTHGYHFRLGVDERTPRGQAASGRAWDTGSGPFGRWDPLSAYAAIAPAARPKAGPEPAEVDRWVESALPRLLGGGPAYLGERSRAFEPSCVACHVQGARLPSRPVTATLDLSLFSTLALRPLGVVKATEGGSAVRWNRALFLPDGSLPGDNFRVQAPTSETCGVCHALTARTGPRLRDWGAWVRTSETTGAVFSPAKLRDSALNLRERDDQRRAWDVHAERLLSCPDCHFSPNDPSDALRAGTGDPAHLRHDARHSSLGEFLRRPSHEFAKGESTQSTLANALDGSMRRCEDCHTTERAHGFLPRAERHLEQLGCETCHIPRVPGPARSVTDYSYPDPEGKPRIEYRGLQGSMRDERTLVTGYEPLWLRRTEQSGKQRVLPYNVVTTFYWVVDAPEGPLPAPLELLARAFSADSAAGRELRQALDRNRDGALGEDERVLDSEALVKRAEALLAQAGARAPRLVGELQPYGVHHGVAPGREALRECAVCHGAASRFLSAFTLAERAPFGVTPQALPDANVRLPAAPGVDASGRLALSPSAAPAGLHVFGTSRYAWLDWAGMLIAALTFVGATTHGALRARARRRPGADS